MNSKSEANFIFCYNKDANCFEALGLVITHVIKPLNFTSYWLNNQWQTHIGHKYGKLAKYIG